MSRVLFVKGYDDDYAAYMASQAFEKKEWTLEQALDDPEGFRKFLDENTGLSEETTVEVVDYEHIDLDFACYVKNNMMDYDETKQVCFWVEGEDV